MLKCAHPASPVTFTTGCGHWGDGVVKTDITLQKARWKVHEPEADFCTEQDLPQANASEQTLPYLSTTWSKLKFAKHRGGHLCSLA